MHVLEAAFDALRQLALHAANQTIKEGESYSREWERQGNRKERKNGSKEKRKVFGGRDRGRGSILCDSSRN